MSMAQIRDLISISEAYHTEVNIKRDFNDIRKIEGYVPNEASRRAMAKIFPGIMPTSTKRVHLITGAYGTGKSHFGLVLASLLRQIPEANSVLVKIGEKDKSTAEIIKRHLQASKKFLIVVPEPHVGSTSFNNAMLIALEEALVREGIVFQPPSQFKLAAEKIESWKKQGQENQDDNPYQKLEKALVTYKTTPDILRDQLNKFSSDAYATFERVHREVTYGTEFLPNVGTDPKELYRQTIEHLRNKEDREGIWVICDEFGLYLRDIAKDPNSRESIHIQQFAEYCKGSEEKQCHFMVIAHQTLADYASGLRSQEDWEKISGRFIGGDYSLTNVGSRHEVVELIDTIITRRIETIDKRNNWQEIIKHPDLPMVIDDLQNAVLYNDQKRNWLQDTLIIGCFPLHPLSTYCLPFLAQEVGQRERTLFTFFNDTSAGGLRDFVDNQPVLNQTGRLNFYTLDHLITYFGPVAERERKPQYKQIMRAREDALLMMGGNSVLAERIINALTIFEIVGVNNLSPTEANLISALHLSPLDTAEAKNLLSTLVNQRVIRQRSNGFFELRRRTGEFDIQEAIQEAKKELRPSFRSFDFLKKLDFYQSKLAPIQATSYEKQHFIRRAAVRDLIIPRSLSNPKEFLDKIKQWYEPNRGKYEGDILMLYVLAEDTAEIEQATKYATTTECQHSQLIVAVPKQVVSLTETLLEIAATQQVSRDHTANKDEADLEELERVIVENIEAVSEKLDKFLQADNLVWYCAGDSTINLARSGEEDYVSTLLKRRFSRTPVVKDDAIANILSGRDISKRDRQQVITKLLEHKGYIAVKKTGGGAEDRIFRSCLKDTEIFETKEEKGAYVEYEVRAKLPEGAVLIEIWELLRGNLMQEEQRIELGALIRKLLQPPYGLSHQLTEILLAAFFRNRLDEFVIFQNYQSYQKKQDSKLLEKVNLDASTISLIVTNPDDYVLLYYQVRPSEREYVNRLIKLVAPYDEDKGEMGIWEKGRNALLGWFTSLPPITTHAQAYENEYTALLVKLLKNKANLENAKVLFRSKLPDTLTVSFSSPPTLNDVEELFNRFEQAYLELMNYADKEAMSLVGKLANLFGSDGSTRDALVSSIRNWHTSKLSDSQRIRVFSGNAGSLKKAVEAEGSIDQRMLMDLPKAMGLGPYTSWVEMLKPELFLMKVEQAKKEIEEWQPKIKEEEVSNRATPDIKPVIVVTPPINPPRPVPIVPPPTSDSVHKVDKETAKAKIKEILASLKLSGDIQKQVLREILSELGS